MKKLTTIFVSLFIVSAACAGEKHGGQHGKHGSNDRKTTQTTNVTQSARSESSAQALASAKSRSKANSEATGGNGTGGNAEATGGAANAAGGQAQVIVTPGSGHGTGLTGRMVPDVSAGAPITSTSCRNGISAGGSGNGWGGLIGFFSEDDMCEWRLLEANYRNSGDHGKANAIRAGMTAQRCKKLAPEDRESFGDLCHKQPAAEKQNVAFSSAG